MMVKLIVKEEEAQMIHTALIARSNHWAKEYGDMVRADKYSDLAHIVGMEIFIFTYQSEQCNLRTGIGGRTNENKLF